MNDETRMSALSWDNVRLVDGDGNVDSSWHVDPANQSRVEWSIGVLRDYQKAEPHVGWHLETRGTLDHGWHDWINYAKGVESNA